MFENHIEMGSKFHHPLTPTHSYTQTNPRYSTALEHNLGLAPEARLVIGSVLLAGSSEVR